MRYFVISDIHSFYQEMRGALAAAGYDDSPDSRLIVLGDCWDRGPDPYLVYAFLREKVRRGTAIMIRGNHEWLMADRMKRGYSSEIDVYNGVDRTVETLMECHMTRDDLLSWVNGAFWKNYIEIGDYIFVHGWIPLSGFNFYLDDDLETYTGFSVMPDWRGCGDPLIWKNASWEKGHLALGAKLTVPGKTIVCGHRASAYFHSRFDPEGAEDKKGADFSIFRGNGCIAIDACTAVSHKANVLVLDIPEGDKEEKE